MSRRVTRPLLLVGFVVVLVAVFGGGYFLKQERNKAAAQSAAKRFTSAWSANKLDSVQFTNVSGADAKAAYASLVGSVGSTPVNVQVANTKVHGKTATVNTYVAWSFGKGQWNYPSTFQLRKEHGKWLPVWEPQVVHPDLRPTTHLALKRVQPPRADILGANDQTIVTSSPVVDVGVRPEFAKDVDALTKSLADLLKVDGDALNKQIKSAKPDAFVPVITLRRSDYDSMKDKLQPLPGTVFREGTLPLAPTRQFASALLGRVGPVTADIVTNSKGRYQAGDVGGLSGLQLQYDEQLAGVAGTNVSLVDKDVNVPPKTLFSIDAVPGQPLHTTIDAKTQQAADDAIASQSKPTSFVAIQASTGAVLADSNGPDVGGLNRAFTAQYPPGSSFKVITTYALLQKGVTANDQVACPPTFTVDGRSFKNAENEAFASAPFHTDFAKSCNTAFASLAPKVPGSALPDAAKAFGLTNEWKSGVATFSGSVPAPATNVDLAATAFGQGKTLVSPLAMATVAAGVDSGSARAPYVVAGSEQPTPTALDQTALATLRSLMREVVTSGTGTAVSHAPGGPVFGKTGTAEFGTADPPQSHAWFIGYQNDIAFAAFVEGGEFGGDTAAPIANAFLINLAK